MNRIKRSLSEFFTQETAAAAGFIERCGSADPVITSLEYDSRKIIGGALFFALPGLHSNGHHFIQEAIEKGAAAIIHEAEINAKKDGIVYLKVSDSRFAMSPVAAAFYGFPSRRMLVAGVTGTEGKSTTVFLIWQLLQLLGKKAGFFSTVQYSSGGEAIWNPEHQTTPEAVTVQRMLWEMAENGCLCAVLESSSHGLSSKTNRLGDVEFDVAVFTNLTHEHMEFHGTWEQYRDDKANLFRALTRHKAKTMEGIVKAPFGVINADDKNAVYYAGLIDKKFSFSVKGKAADLTLKSIHSTAYGNWYNIYNSNDNNFITVRDCLPGAFNAGNLLAALLAVSGMSGLPVTKTIAVCPQLLPVRGRMTAINKGQPFEVLVDYAHTPSSFQAIFPPLRQRILKQNKGEGRIISLFGSAGERDTKKRAEQGKIAALYSDIIILTDEDPRREQPMAILEEIEKGISEQNASEEKTVIFIREENLFLIPDRPAAIRKALSLARPKDIVLLLGKGHENSIIYKDRIMPYDEITEAEKALEELL